LAGLIVKYDLSATEGDPCAQIGQVFQFGGVRFPVGETSCLIIYKERASFYAKLFIYKIQFVEQMPLRYFVNLCKRCRMFRDLA